MPRRTRRNPGNRINITLIVQNFCTEKDKIDTFLGRINGYTRINNEYKQWCYELAIIRLYCAFEQFMLDILKAALNNDASYFCEEAGIKQIDHFNQDMAEFAIVGDGYFDFKGRDGLIKKVKDYLPNDHWLVICIKRPEYKETLERLSALRNYAAHSGINAKSKARKAVKQGSITAPGVWLSTRERGGKRYEKIANDLYSLAERIRREGHGGDGATDNWFNG